MRIITYSLRNGVNSNEYYEAAEQTAAIVSEEGLRELAMELQAFKRYIRENNIEVLRSDVEYLMELLTLGVLLLRYSDDAVVLNQISKQVLTNLVEMRQKGGSLKPSADFLRGLLGTFVLYSEHRPELVSALQFNTKNFTKLLEWLTAAGEFSQEVKRLSSWLDYAKGLSDEESSELIASAVSFAIWFEEESLKHLGKYTEGLEAYLENVSETHRWRENLIFCSRQRLEYHLNMVGAEIMNKAYREDFIKTKRKAVFLPACIRKRIRGGCKAKEKKGVLYCASCDLGCQVREIKELGEQHGYEVLIIPHESSAFSDEKVPEGELGIIGIACVTNLLAGGWKAKSSGIPAQCVLLDYCGCKNHWDDEGFPTAINIERLKSIMLKSS